MPEQRPTRPVRLGYRFPYPAAVLAWPRNWSAAATCSPSTPPASGRGRGCQHSTPGASGGSGYGGQVLSGVSLSPEGPGIHCITKCSGSTEFQPLRVSHTVMPRIRDPGHRTPGSWPVDNPPQRLPHQPCGERAAAASPVQKGHRQLMARPTATWMTTSESSWPISSLQSRNEPGSRAQPSKARVDRGKPVRHQLHRTPTQTQQARWEAVQQAKSQGISLRAIARELAMSRVTARKYAQAEEPAHQETQRQGTGQGRSPGQITDRRRLARVTYSLDNNRTTAAAFAITSLEMVIGRG